VNKPKEIKGRMIGILPRYNYIAEVKYTDRVEYRPILVIPVK